MFFEIVQDGLNCILLICLENVSDMKRIEIHY